MGINERIHFRLLHMPCCGHFHCWIGPRLPMFCPECGANIAISIREGVVFVDDNAHIRYAAPKPLVMW